MTNLDRRAVLANVASAAAAVAVAPAALASTNAVEASTAEALPLAMPAGTPQTINVRRLLDMVEVAVEKACRPIALAKKSAPSSPQKSRLTLQGKPSLTCFSLWSFPEVSVASLSPTLRSWNLASARRKTGT